MSSFGPIFRFELAWQLRTPLFWGLCVLYFIAHFLTQGTDSITIGEPNYRVHLNSPFQVMLNEGALSYYGLMPIMVFLVTSITRDYDARMAEFVFVQPLNRIQFLLARFMGGLMPALLVALAGVVGNAVSLLMPWIDPQRLAPYTLLPHVYSYFGLTLPYVFITGVCIFAVAALTRSAALALGTAIIYVAINLTAAIYAGLYAPEWLGLVDPSGAVALISETRYWSVAELNTQYPVGLLPLNRLVWLMFSFAVLGFTCWRYRFNIQGQSLPALGWFAGRRNSALDPAASAIRAATDYTWRGQLAQMGKQLRLDMAVILKNPVLYIAIGLIMAAALFEHGRFVDAIGVPAHPVTSLFTGFFRYAILPYALVLIMYYAGELVFRDREKSVNEIIAASPYVDWIMPVAKVLALCLMITLLLFCAMITSMLLQALAGYTHFEIGLYLQAMFVHNASYYFMCAVVAVFVQSLMPSKWAGIAALTVFFVFAQSMPQMGLENVLYIPFSVPHATHSDIAGFGPVQPLINSLIVYWGFLAVVVIVLAVLLYPRGYYGSLREHWHDARGRISRGARVWSAVALLGFVSAGTYIYYNTHVLNEYKTSDDITRLNAGYERLYGEYENRPAPNYTEVDLEIDIYPHERRLEMRGSGLLINQDAEPINEFVLSPAPGLQIDALAVEGATPVTMDSEQGFFLFRFDEPLLPGQSTTASWNLSRHNRGFANTIHDVSLLENGTYIDGRELLPAPGYRQSRELVDAGERRQYGLQPAERVPPLGDPDFLDVITAGVSSRAVMHTVISTSADQTAIVPGKRIRRWTEGNRNYFEYRSQQPIWPAISISSGNFDVATDQWNDTLLEVYYDAKHPYNVQTMLDTTKQALDYYSREFAPYQIPYFRIIEYPRYRTALTAFYGTVPYSETVGFIAKPENMDNLDYGVLHELAHQWWGHLALSAYMQGRMVLNETLAQYSTFMMYKEHASPDVLHYVLRFTLDSYLNARSTEPNEELPVMLNEEQGYIAYNKGALVMFYLQELIGSERMHSALRNYLDKFALQPPPFPTAKDLVDEIRATAGPEYDQLITDLFEKIMFYEVAVEEGSAVSNGNGYEVTIPFTANQFQGDGQGNLTEVQLGAWFDVVVFPQGDAPLPQREPLYRQMHFIETGKQTLTVQVNGRPGAAGIDPFHMMIDSEPGNNVAVVRLAQ